MKILVLSDSHGTIRYMSDAISHEQPDYVIHLGDHARDAEQLRLAFPMLPIAGVRGNCDSGEFDVLEQKMAEYGGVRVLMAHGHRYGVKMGLLRYYMTARENQVDVALFGHTHQATCMEKDGVWLLNPGSCGYGRPSYGIVEIQNGKVSCSVKYLSESEELS